WATRGDESFEKGIPNALEILFSSIAAQKQVFLEYQSMAAPTTTSRYIEPAGVFHESAHWYLYAFCHLRNQYRQFRTDRIKSIKSTDKPFSRLHDPVSRYIEQNREGP